MKYVIKIILIVTCLIIMLPFGGCGRKKQITAQKAGVLKPEAPGKEVLDHGEAVVDISNVAQGYVALRYKGSAKKISVEVIGKNNKVYKYFIERTKEPTYFPLTSGNGTYQISVYENVQDDEYSVLMMDSFEVKLKNKFLPFLYPNQYVEFTSKTKAVKEAKKLAKDSKDDLAIVKAVYNYVVKNVKYDDEKAQNVQSGYLPSVDETLKTKKGICFDYAALMTAMLRSQGIPTKLEIGYSGDIYHAWISTWLNEKGWVDNIIQFDGKSWELMDPTLAANSDNKEDVKEYIGNGEHYVLRDVSFVIEPGEKVAFVGENGAGKTTLVRIIAGLENADRGTVSGAGVVSFDFQEDRLINDISAADNIMLVLDKNDFGGHDKKTMRKIINENLAEVLKDYPSDKSTGTYSGGMKRRVCLVRAMMKKSDTVILDEPFSGMDEETKILAAEYIKKHRDGRICIVVTHEKSDSGLLDGGIYLLTTDKAVDTI